MGAVLKRDSLYVEVWAEPMSAVCKRYGLSGACSSRPSRPPGQGMKWSCRPTILRRSALRGARAYSDSAIWRRPAASSPRGLVRPPRGLVLGPILYQKRYNTSQLMM